MAEDADDLVVVIGDEPGAAPAAAEPVPEGVVLVEDDRDDDDKLPKHAVLQPDGSVKLPLRFPVEFRWKRPSEDQVRTETYTELHLRRLTGEDLMAIQSTDKKSASAVAIGRSARMPQNRMNELFKRMDGSDAQAAGEVVSFFLSPGATTGR